MSLTPYEFFVKVESDRKAVRAPFQVFFGTSAPSDSEDGTNGDFAFCYGNDDLTIYKKILGSWSSVSTGGGFVGFNSRNSQIMEMTSDFSEITITDFTFQDSDGLVVEIDGITQYEGALAAWTRTSSLSKIIFSETVPASLTCPVKIFVGKYATTGFAGFNGTNSQTFTVTSNTDNVTLTNFTIKHGDSLRLEVDGCARYEGVSDDWVRDVANNRVIFNETIIATPTVPSVIFIGRYN